MPMFDLTFAEKYGGPAGHLEQYFIRHPGKIFEEFNKRYPEIRGWKMLQQLNNFDWQCAFEFAGERTEYQFGVANIRAAHPMSKVPLDPFSREDVEGIAHIAEGENDEKNWILVGLLKDGRWFTLDAGCCYTGWDCSGGGEAALATTYDGAVRFGLSAIARQRLGIVL
jgi:hypothetical protein